MVNITSSADTVQLVTWGSPQSVSVATTTTEIIAANGSRKGALVTNNGSADVFIALGTPAILNKGHRINSGGGNYEITLDNNLSVQAVNGIVASGTVEVVFMEAT